MDIDMDFDERYRGDDPIRNREVRSDHVAQTSPFPPSKDDRPCAHSARVPGFPYGPGDRIAVDASGILGRDATIDQCLNPPGAGAEDDVRDYYANASGLRELYASDLDARRVIDTARGLEGLRRQDSIHAAAVVISPEPLTSIVPIQRKGDDAEVVTQFEMHAIEQLGLLKMDFLGLRNLTTIERCVESVAENTGTRPDIDGVVLDDPVVYEMLSRGNGMGVFQLEGSGMRSLMRSLRPTAFRI